MNDTDENQETEINDLIQMLEDVEGRLIEDAAGPAPTGLTDPDKGGTERWEAAQVWAHMAEFVTYWQAQLEHVVDSYRGQPVPFGRTKEDAARIEGIETGRSAPIAVLMERVHNGIETTRRYLPTLSVDQWHSVGLHPRRGEMTVPQIVEKFTIDHLEEHADQLDDLGVKVYLETGEKKVFVTAVDWPGWSRGGKTENEALDNLLGYGERYATAIGVSTNKLGPRARARIEVVERLTGNATTDFGAPGVVPDLDRAPISGERLDELIALLDACWTTFDKAAVKARGRELGPSGPRGGGRTLDKMVAHVIEAQAAYLSAVGGPARTGTAWPDTKRVFRAALAQRARGELPDIGPRGGKRWPAPYAIRRSAWHALDHAWEIEDRLD